MISLKAMWEGIVEDVMDPLKNGRVRVRIFGVHTENKAALPTEFLPWCDIAMPVTSAYISGVGMSPTGMVPGTMVLLVPREPDDLQSWLVLFTVGGMREKIKDGSSGFNDPEGLYPRSSTNHDVNVLARGLGDVTDAKAEGYFDPVAYSAAADKAANVTVDKVDTSPRIDTPTKPDPQVLANAPWMDFAVSQVGVNEKDNPAKIKEFHTQGGGSSSWGGETPWCASFIGWSLKKAGLKGTGGAMARGYTNYGKDVSKESSIPYGSIVVIKGSRGPSSGHVFFYTGKSGDRIEGVGGNQSSASARVGAFDNGGEVTKSSFPMSSVVAIRFPV